MEKPGFPKLKPGFKLNLTARMIGWLGAARPGPSKPPRVALAYRNRRRFAYQSLASGLIVLLLLQLGLGVAAEQSLYIRDPGYSDKEIRLTRQEALHPEGPRIVMLGTSRTAAAFHAGRAREQLGSGVVFNFGIPASGPVTHLLYLRRLLADGHKPNLLLLEVLPPSLADVPAIEDGRPVEHLAPLEARFFFGDRMRRSELHAAVQYGFSPEYVNQKWLESVAVPFHALRFPIMGRLAPSAQPWHLRFDWSRGCDEFGWGAPFAETVTPLEYEFGLEKAIKEYVWILRDMHPNGGGSRALAEIAKLCREQGIQLKLVMMPEASGFRVIYPPVVVERMHTFLTGVCREHGCELIDAREWLPDTGFSDGHHMLKGGAVEFTDRISRAAVDPHRERMK